MTSFTYTTYHFRPTEQDPVVDKIRTVSEKTGYTVARISTESGISKGTLAKWFSGQTRRPQYATVCAAVRTMGYDFVLTKSNGALVKRFPSHKKD